MMTSTVFVFVCRLLEVSLVVREKVVILYAALCHLEESGYIVQEKIWCYTVSVLVQGSWREL